MNDPGRTSASRLPLLKLCQYSARDDVGHPKRESSDAADSGTARHAAYAALALGQPLTKEMHEAAGVGESHTSNVHDWLKDNIADIPYEKRIVERAFAYDPATDTARELVTKGHRDYSQARPGELVGSVDLAWVDARGVLHIRDWKCGLRSRVDPAESNMQLLALGLYLGRALGVDAVTVGVLMVDDEGEVDGSDVATLDAFDLAGVAGTIVDLLASIPNSQPVIGPWCAEKYCALNGICPAHVDIWSRFIMTVPGAPVVMPGEALPVPQTPAHAAFLVDLLPIVEGSLEAAKRGLRQYADEHGLIATRDGKWWGKRLIDKRAIAPTPLALAVLEENGLGAAVETKTTTTVTLGALSKACKAKTKRGEGAKLERRVLDALGPAVVTTPMVQYGYVKVNGEEEKEAS